MNGKTTTNHMSVSKSQVVTKNTNNRPVSSQKSKVNPPSNNSLKYYSKTGGSGKNRQINTSYSQR